MNTFEIMPSCQTNEVSQFFFFFFETYFLYLEIGAGFFGAEVSFVGSIAAVVLTVALPGHNVIKLLRS
jgi:hypothetical protein